MPHIQSRFAALLAPNLDAVEVVGIPALTPALAQKLIERIDSIPLFAHAYSLLGNFTHGTFRPRDLLVYAHDHELKGICIHLLDGEERSLGRMSDAELLDFGAEAKKLHLAVHLEISSTEKTDVNEVVRIARILDVEHIRVYSRYEGLLSAVLGRVDEDMLYLAELADKYSLQFYFEQHEELKSSEIAAALQKLDHPRIHALFDFGNMVNACERPMDALHELAPHIRQVHMKGIKIIQEGNGFGHRGVLQGTMEDDLPGPRMLFELLMLGGDRHQLIAFALEQENHYRAPAFRLTDEKLDPFIPYRDMSTTDLPDGLLLAEMLVQEPQWAVNQLTHVRMVLARLRELAACRLAESELVAAAPAAAATSTTNWTQP
jgi:Sugar phosphate isomerases/epimerases